jgi:hypothetical protein
MTSLSLDAGNWEVVDYTGHPERRVQRAVSTCSLADLNPGILHDDLLRS